MNYLYLIPTLYLLNEKCKFKRMSSIDKIKFLSDNNKYNIKNCIIILRNLVENLKKDVSVKDCLISFYKKIADIDPYLFYYIELLEYTDRSYDDSSLCGDILYIDINEIDLNNKIDDLDICLIISSN